MCCDVNGEWNLKIMLCRNMIYSEVSIMLFMDYIHFHFPAFYSAATAVEDNFKKLAQYKPTASFLHPGDSSVSIEEY